MDRIGLWFRLPYQRQGSVRKAKNSPNSPLEEQHAGQRTRYREPRPERRGWIKAPGFDVLRAPWSKSSAVRTLDRIRNDKSASGPRHGLESQMHGELRNSGCAQAVEGDGKDGGAVPFRCFSSARTD